jgi:hypothetical protein
MPTCELNKKKKGIGKQVEEPLKKTRTASFIFLRRIWQTNG